MKTYVPLSNKVRLVASMQFGVIVRTVGEYIDVHLLTQMRQEISNDPTSI